MYYDEDGPIGGSGYVHRAGKPEGPWGPCTGVAAAAIIELVSKDEETKILLVDRVTKPNGWACLATHFELDGSSNHTDLRKRVRDKTGIELPRYRVTAYPPMFLDSPCRRGGMKHRWNVYRWTTARVPGSDALTASAEYHSRILQSFRFAPTLDPAEFRAYQWVSLSELHSVKLEPVWRHIFQSFGYLPRG